jgi:outer membrane protein assembly factor BamB
MPEVIESPAMTQWTVAMLMLALAAHWPQWRGPHGLAVSTDSGLPTEWSPTTNIAWKTAIPGRGHSSPIVWGERIFLTTSI